MNQNTAALFRERILPAVGLLTIGVFPIFLHSFLPTAKVEFLHPRVVRGVTYATNAPCSELFRITIMNTSDHVAEDVKFEIVAPNDVILYGPPRVQGSDGVGELVSFDSAENGSVPRIGRIKRLASKHGISVEYAGCRARNNLNNFSDSLNPQIFISAREMPTDHAPAARTSQLSPFPGGDLALQVVVPQFLKMGHSVPIRGALRFAKSAPANGKVKIRLGGAPFHVSPEEVEVDVKAGEVWVVAEWIVYPTATGEYRIDARAVYQPAAPLGGGNMAFEQHAISPSVQISIRDLFGLTAIEETIGKLIAGLGILSALGNLLVRWLFQRDKQAPA
jgi:hypothetical protein